MLTRHRSRTLSQLLEEDEERSGSGKADLTPMIDVVFLLLIFFLLTTRFIVPEKVISQLLPTDKGSLNTPQEVVTPPQELNIRIYPAGLSSDMGVQELQQWWQGVGDPQAAVIQVSGHQSLLVRSDELSAASSREQLDPALERIRRYVHDHLAAAEEPMAGRGEQRTVNIHCFSGLSWKYALVVYDAVRDYERQQAPGLSLAEAREVSLAPPRLRRYSSWEQGNELWEIMRLR